MYRNVFLQVFDEESEMAHEESLYSPFLGLLKVCVDTPVISGVVHYQRAISRILLCFQLLCT